MELAKSPVGPILEIVKFGVILNRRIGRQGSGVKTGKILRSRRLFNPFTGSVADVIETRISNGYVAY